MVKVTQLNKNFHFYYNLSITKKSITVDLIKIIFKGFCYGN